jgi:hypothetical protein
VYLRYEDFVLAEKYFGKALEIFGSEKEYQRFSQTLLSLSRLAYARGKYALGLRLLDSSEVYLNKAERSYSPKMIILAEIYEQKGKNLAALKKNELAREFFYQAFRMSKRNRQLDVMVDASAGLAKIWEAMKQYDSAYCYLLLHKAYSDTAFNEKSIRELAYQDASFKYERELARERELRGREKAKQKRNTFLMSILIIGLIFSLVTLALLLKLGRNKVRRIQLEQSNLKKELELRNKELTTHVLYQLKRNEFILDISRKLTKSISKLKPENRKIIDEVIRKIERESEADVWKDFEIRFQQVHNDFYKNLGNKYPDLTPNEMRLAAFLKLNMNTKDISAITYQSTNSIDVARSRLRQKFGLSKEESLATFLSGY